jgi:hypothetical protein
LIRSIQISFVQEFGIEPINDCLGHLMGFRFWAVHNSDLRASFVKVTSAEQEKECGRYEGQASTITLLVQSGQLLSGLDEKEARDLFWTLTARDIYRMLVIERKWSSDRYEKWLSEAIVSALVIQKRG